MDVEFSKVYHLVDSSTVLGYVHKADAKLKPYEGIRVSEIQTSGAFIDGRLQNWGWIESNLNPADWATKPRLASELSVGSFWQQGPEFLKEDVEMWPVRYDFKTGPLDGEIKQSSALVVLFVSVEMSLTMKNLLQRPMG